MSPRVLLLLCCPPQAAIELWHCPVIDCACSRMSHTRPEPLIIRGAMDDPATEMQPGQHTVSSDSWPYRGMVGREDMSRTEI